MLGAGLIMSHFAKVTLLEDPAPSWLDTEQMKHSWPQGRPRPAAANVIKTDFKVISDLD